MSPAFARLRTVLRLRAVLVATAVVFGAVLLGGCARPAAPIGGPVPETPLRVVASSPAPLSVVAPFSGAVKIQFERSLSERLASGGGSIQDAIVVSPMTGAVRIERGGNSVDVSLEGGFLPDMVYRVTILPRFQDRYQNRMAVPYDLIFSTGPELAPNFVGGVVESRLTEEALPGIRVDANIEGGSFPYSAITDSTGIFTFPHIPEGRYNLVAYDDQNRNRRPDFAERQDSQDLAVNNGDTTVVFLRLLAPDTTAAVLQRVALQDSLWLRLTFDDYFDPVAPLDGVVARLLREGANAPEVVEIVHSHIWRARSATSDDAPAGPLLPSREIILLLSRPLLPGITYQLEVEGVVNLHEIPGGGGEAEVEGPPVRPETPGPGTGLQGQPAPIGDGGGGLTPPPAEVPEVSAP